MENDDAVLVREALFDTVFQCATMSCDVPTTIEHVAEALRAARQVYLLDDEKPL